MAKRNPRQTDLRDWRTITDEREKYAAYLCSREWCVLKEAVHRRAKGTCERCGVLPIAAVHHLTYERKYREYLTDLAGWCHPCHEFTHGKSSFDLCSLDAAQIEFARFAVWAKAESDKPPPPLEFVCGLAELKSRHRNRVKAARLCAAAGLEDVVYDLCGSLGFAMPHPKIIDRLPFDPVVISAIYQAVGLDDSRSGEFIDCDSDEDWDE